MELPLLAYILFREDLTHIWLVAEMEVFFAKLHLYGENKESRAYQGK